MVSIGYAEAFSDLIPLRVLTVGSLSMDIQTGEAGCRLRGSRGGRSGVDQIGQVASTGDAN